MERSPANYQLRIAASRDLTLPGCLPQLLSATFQLKNSLPVLEPYTIINKRAGKRCVIKLLREAEQAQVHH